MKKLMFIVTIIYLVVMGVSIYMFFGPVLVSSYHTIQWKGLETQVPEDFNVKTYQKDRWDVYFMHKLWMPIKIGITSAVNPAGFAEKRDDAMFITSSSDSNIFFLARDRKQFEAVYAENIGDHTVYFSARAGSVYSAVQIVKRMTAYARFNGEKLSPPEPSIPLRHYITDIIFLVGVSLPFFLIIIIMNVSGMKPNAKHFEGDPIRIEESNVFYSFKKKYRRKNSFCYLALTTSRLMIFVFRRPVLVIDLSKDDTAIEFDKKKIIIKKGKEEFHLKPSNIDRWKTQLSTFR